MSTPSEEDISQIPPDEMPTFPADEYEDPPQDPIDLGLWMDVDGGDS